MVAEITAPDRPFKPHNGRTDDEEALSCCRGFGFHDVHGQRASLGSWMYHPMGQWQDRAGMRLRCRRDPCHSGKIVSAMPPGNDSRDMEHKVGVLLTPLR